jgi:hypothetical protein
MDLSQLLASTTDPIRIAYLFGTLLGLELEKQ